MTCEITEVFFCYDVHRAPEEDIRFTARKQAGQEEGTVSCALGQDEEKCLSRKMTGEEWRWMTDAFFETLQIPSRKRNYAPRAACVMGEYRWDLRIILADYTEYAFQGHGAVPNWWDDLMEVFQPYVTELDVNLSQRIR